MKGRIIMFGPIKNKIKTLISGFSTAVNLISSIISIVSGLVSLKVPIQGLWLQGIFSLAVGILIFIICLVIYKKLLHKGNIKLHSMGSGSISACYDDIFSIAKKDTTAKKFVVIPVNTTFDTIVDEAGAQVSIPLVSSNTLHGQWLKKHGDYGLTLEEINHQIDQSLQLQNEKPVKVISKEQKSRGNLKEYPIGTIASVEGIHNTIFLLAALSSFDEKNRAHASEDGINRVIKKIVHYCDIHGQQAPVYLPVMGTGLARTHLGKLEAFKLIYNAILSSAAEVNESYTIVIYTSDKKDIPLDKIKDMVKE